MTPTPRPAVDADLTRLHALLQQWAGAALSAAFIHEQLAIRPDCLTQELQPWGVLQGWLGIVYPDHYYLKPQKPEAQHA